MGPGLDESVLIVLDIRTAAEKGHGKQPDGNSKAEDDTNGPVRILANDPVGVLSGGDCAFLHRADTRLEELFAVPHDHFEIFEELFQIDLLAITRFGSHEVSIIVRTILGYGVFPSDVLA